jgi:hypothetical protein
MLPPLPHEHSRRCRGGEAEQPAEHAVQPGPCGRRLARLVLLLLLGV